MNQHPIEPHLKEALAAIRHAQDTRGYHARRTKKGSPMREDDLQTASERVKSAMKPLRSFLGRSPSKTQTEAHAAMHERVTQASKELQSERRKLWKMMKRDKVAA